MTAAAAGRPDVGAEVGGPGRRGVLAAGAAGIVTLSLPSALAAATGGAVAPDTAAPESVGTLTFSDVTETGFTVSWSA